MCTASYVSMYCKIYYIKLVSLKHANRPRKMKYNIEIESRHNDYKM